MSDWPELERRLTDSAHRRYGRRWLAWLRLALVPVVGVLAAITLIALLRTPASDERAVTPADERAVPTPAVGDSARDSDRPTGPGLHSVGLDAAAYGDVTMQSGRGEPSDVRRSPAVHRGLDQPGRERRVQRQGHGADPAAERGADHARPDRSSDRPGRSGHRHAPTGPSTADRSSGDDRGRGRQGPGRENARARRKDQTLLFPALFTNGSIASRALRDTAREPACQTGVRP